VIAGPTQPEQERMAEWTVESRKIDLDPFNDVDVALERSGEHWQVPMFWRVRIGGRNTPFFWIGDTWWPSLSTRLSSQDFQALADDRQTKGFKVVQVCAGLAPFMKVGEEMIIEA
jgi:hypothetical protein